MVLLLSVFSCTKSDFVEIPAEESITQSSVELGSRTADDAPRIDPIYPKDVALERNELLSSISGDQYSVESNQQFIYDIEYFVNADNYTTINQDRNHMFFKEIAYPAPSNNDFQSLSEIRELVSNDVSSILGDIALPSASKWLDVINVSSSSDGSTIYCTIGTGVNFDPCPGSNCPDAELEAIAELFNETSGGNSCELPSQDFFPPTTEYIDMTCATDFYGALDFAKDFTNRGEFINGKLEPAECNPVDPSIFTDFADIPRSNLIEVGEFSINYENADIVNPDWCFAEFPIFQFLHHTANCAPESAFCIPEIEAHFLMQEGIATEIESMHAGWPYNLPDKKFYCTTYYSIDFVDFGTSYYGAIGAFYTGN